MTATYQVRFHLGQGEHFGHIQVKSPYGTFYINPTESSLILTDCRLRNQAGTAQKIHEGANKTVCAWIEAKGLEICAPLSFDSGTQCNFNPKKAPHWLMGGANSDGAKVPAIYSVGRNFYAKEES